jgi:hypothetical protein
MAMSDRRVIYNQTCTRRVVVEPQRDLYTFFEEVYIDDERDTGWFRWTGDDAPHSFCDSSATALAEARARIPWLADVIDEPISD